MCNGHRNGLSVTVPAPAVGVTVPATAVGVTVTATAVGVTVTATAVGDAPLVEVLVAEVEALHAAALCV